MTKNELTEKEIALLLEICKATVSESLVYANENETANLVNLDLVEINVTMTDDEGKVATRATKKGVLFMESEKKSNDVFELEVGIPLPAPGRVGRGAIVYPFARMEVGQCFHVPVSNSKPNPVKNLASTVSSANKRFKNENGEIVRKFVLRRTEKDDPKGPGARVFRVE